MRDWINRDIKGVDLSNLASCSNPSTGILNYWLDSQLIELAYQTTGNTDVFVLLDDQGHYCIDASGGEPTLVLFANKVDAFLAKDIVNASQQLNYTVYHCRSDKHPRITNYSVGHTLFSLTNTLDMLKNAQCMVCIGYMAQKINGKQHFVRQEHGSELPDACFALTNNEVLLHGFALRHYFSELFMAYDQDDDIIKSMLAKLSSINLLSDESLKQRVEALHTFLANDVRDFNPTLPFVTQVVL